MPLFGVREWRLALAAGLAYLLLTLLVYPFDASHDAAVNLHYAILMLRGGVPYVDFVDTNLPLIIYVGLIPASISEFLGLHPLPVFNVFVWTLLVVAVWGIWRELARADGPAMRHLAGFLGLAWMAVSYFLLEGLLLEWGQREHFFVLMFTPALFLRWNRWRGTGIALPAALGFGLLAGIGANIKPHFLVTVACVEIYGLVAHRSWRALLKPEVGAFFAVTLIYGAHFFAVEPIRENFLGRYLPMVAAGYTAFDPPFSEVLAHSWTWWPGALGILALAAPNRREPVLADISRLLGVFTLGAVVVYFLQNKGWFYHAIPPFFGAVGSLLACALSWVAPRFANARSAPAADHAADSAAEGGERRLRVGRWIAAGFVAACALLFWDRFSQDFAPRRDNPFRPVAEAYTEPGDPVLFLTMSVYRQYPYLLEMNRSPATRYPAHIFPLAFAYAGEPGVEAGESFPYHRPEEMPPVERELLRELHEDIDRYQPKVVFIDASKDPQGMPQGFNVLEYFRSVGFLDTALADYESADSVGGTVVFLRQDVKDASKDVSA